MKYLPSREASKILGLHPNTLRTYADNGTIEFYKTESGQRRYNVEASNSRPYYKCIKINNL